MFRFLPDLWKRFRARPRGLGRPAPFLAAFAGAAALAALLIPSSESAPVKLAPPTVHSQDQGQGKKEAAAAPVQLPERYVEAIDRAAVYFSLPDQTADQLLRRLGFNHPGIADADWQRMSAYHRIETAYLSAEAADPNRGGERFLALLSRALAQEYEPMRSDPQVQALINLGDQLVRSSQTRIEFRELAPGTPRGTIPARFLTAINALTVYIEAGPFGTQSALSAYFERTPDQAVDLVRRHRTTRDTMLAALAELPNDVARDRAMEHFVAALDNEFESAREVRALDHWRPQRPREVAMLPPTPLPPTRFPPPADDFRWRPGDGPGPFPSGFKPRTGPGGGMTPEVRKNWTAYNLQKYQRFIKVQYPTTPRVPFRGGIRSIRGFGGVLLGNRVSADGLSPVKEIHWRADPKNPGKGSLQFITADKPLTLAPVLAEDAFAAGRIVFGGTEGVDPLVKGEAVGLFGLMRSIPYFDCGPSKIADTGRQWQFVIHPVIANLDLGWAALLCDVSVLEERRAHLLRGFAKPEEAKDFAAIFNDPKKRWETYKFHDVPMRIRADGNSLVVERDPADEYPAELRRAALLSLRFYKYQTNLLGQVKRNEKGEPLSDDWDADAAFYPLVPALTAAAPAYARLNEFARVLAAFRWASEGKPTWSGIGAEPAGAPKAASVIVSGRGVFPAQDFDPFEACLTMRNRILLRLSTDRLAGQPAQGPADLRIRPQYQEKLRRALAQTEGALLSSLLSAGVRPKNVVAKKGKLEATDPADPKRPGRHHQVIPLEVQPGAMYVVFLGSRDFDAYLRLEDADKRTVAEDDDSGGNLDALLVLVPERTTTYRIIATTYGAGMSGNYDLRVERFDFKRRSD
jgi:hypothetical protein